MEDKEILKSDENLNLYLVRSGDKIVIVNDRVSKSKDRPYKYWEYKNNVSFTVSFDNNSKSNINGEAIIFNKVGEEKDSENYEFIYGLIKNAMFISQKTYISDVLDLIEKYFRNVYSLITKETVQGLFSEILFIKYMKEKGMDIESNYHKNENSNFDFYFNSTNTYLELKSAINDIHDYKISHNQLSYDSKNTFFVTVNLWPDENGCNLLQLIDKINFHTPELLEKIEIYKSSLENDICVKEQKFSLSKYEISIYKGNDLPRLSLLNRECEFNIKNIKYDISTAGIQPIQLDYFIRSIK